MSLLTTSKDASALGEASSELACCKKGWAKASSMDIRFFGSLLSNWEEDRDSDKEKDRSGVRDGDRDRDKENDGSGVRDGGERERDNGGATRYTWYYEVEYYEVGGMKV